MIHIISYNISAMAELPNCLHNPQYREEVILKINENPEHDFEKILQKIYCGEEINDNYYQMKHICSICDTAKITEMILNIINDRIKIYKTIIIDEININIFMQLYRDFRSIIKNIHKITDNFMSLKKNATKTQKMGLFYKAILNDNADKLADMFSTVDISNKWIINDAIEFIQAMYYFAIHKHHTKNYDNVIHKIINRQGFIKMLSKYIHYAMIHIDDEMTMYPKLSEKKITDRMFRLIKILSRYGDQKVVCEYHRWYLQARIINPLYPQHRLMTELRYVYQFNDPLSKKMKDSIYDVINSKDKKCIIMDRSNWKMINSDLTVNNPIKLDPDINWSSLYGIVTLKTHFRKNITITCYMSQAIVLLYFNGEINITKNKLSMLSGFNTHFISKILDGLVSSNLISYSTVTDDGQSYIVNTDYQTNVDLRRFFIEAFEQEIDES